MEDLDRKNEKTDANGEFTFYTSAAQSGFSAEKETITVASNTSPELEAAADPSADFERELFSLNALCVGNRNIVRFARAENLKPGSIESTEGGDGRFHWTKTVLADAIAEITHSECIARNKLNFEYSGP